MDKDSRLTREEFWNNIYDREVPNKTFIGRFKPFIKKVVGEKIFDYMINDYSKFSFWSICSDYLPKNSEFKLLEVGSAPGHNLIGFKEKFGYIPFGVEYSSKGVKTNQELFKRNNINPNNIIYSDFFSDDFQNDYEKFFDIVISLGFIEHFTNSEEVIKKHLNILKDDGYCVITIPNIRGINYILTYLFNSKSLNNHHLEIMNKNIFKKLFVNEKIVIEYLNYYGIFSFGLFNTKNKLMSYLLQFLNYIQFILNLIFRYLIRNQKFENQFFSPHLVAIIKKLNNIDKN